MTSAKLFATTLSDQRFLTDRVSPDRPRRSRFRGRGPGIPHVYDLGLALRLVDELPVHVPDEESHRDIETDIADLSCLQRERQLALDFGLGRDLIVNRRTIGVKKSIRHRLADYFPVQANVRLNGGAEHRCPVEIDSP